MSDDIKLKVDMYRMAAWFAFDCSGTCGSDHLLGDFVISIVSRLEKYESPEAGTAFGFDQTAVSIRARSKARSILIRARSFARSV